jgi:signal transduction histidine kinase
MGINITKINIIKNIFKRRFYFLMLVGSMITAVSIPFIAQPYIAPSFYNQMIQNTLDDAKKVCKHLARHQNVDATSQVLFTAINKLKEDFNLVKIRLFDPQGKIVFSTESKEIGNINKKDYYFQIVAKGKMYYKVVQKGMKTLDGGSILKDVAEIYVPIMKGDIFMGSSEIYYDITDRKENFNNLMQKISLEYILFAIFLLSVSLLVIYMLSRNNLIEQNIERELSNKVDQKTKELQEINTHLESRIKEEVEKNREKDSHLFQQSKLASMGEMIGNIAHQWRQPLSAITSTASSIFLNSQLGILENDEIEKKMEGIVAKANFLSETINNFRDFFKVDQKQEEFNLVKTISKVESIIDSNFSNENIQLIHKYDNTPIMITSLEGEISQVIINILNNSYDNFKQTGQDVRVVEISITQNMNRVTIKVSDNGGGIPKEIIDKVFEPYFTTKHQSQGTGIGLYMCAQIIQSHLGGTITAKNDTLNYDGAEYRGACFEMSFKI